MHRVADRIIRRVIPKPTERQHIGNQIDAAFIFVQPTPVGLMRPKGIREALSIGICETRIGGRRLILSRCAAISGKDVAIA